MTRGRFIVFEGIDGSGKTTALRSVVTALRDDGIDIMATKEETPTWTGEAVRRAIKERAPPLTTTFLFLADRARHVPEIEAALASGRHVLCDRYRDSTLAYQSVTLDGHVADPMAFLQSLHAPLPLAPDHVVLFDLAPTVALRRAVARGATTPYEKEAFLERVAAAYRGLAAASPASWTILDADRPAESVADDALAVVRGLLA